MSQCVTPTGRTDGHGKFVEGINGVLCCMFCKQPIDEDDCRTCGGQGICTETLDSGDMSGTCPDCHGTGLRTAGSK